VRKHLENSYQPLQVTSRTAAVARAPTVVAADRPADDLGPPVDVRADGEVGSASGSWSRGGRAAGQER
jgi:hypothetical protein